MDEQKIMIDNVDVSECEFFEECEINIDDSECLAHSRHFYEGTFYDCCDEHPDCYYKQLKRKEQECEELKEQLKRKEENYQKLLSKSNKYIHNLVDENVQDISNLARQLEQLKTENEKLKKQVCGLRQELKSMIDKICCKYNIEAKTYHEKIVEIINNLDKYEQTLIEIKEIAEKDKKDICNNCAWINTDSCDPEYYTCGELIKILQKIKEVLNGTNP